MEPEKAAAVLQRLPDDQVSRVLAQMDPDSAGAIMDALPTGVAARLSRALPICGCRLATPSPIPTGSRRLGAEIGDGSPIDVLQMLGAKQGEVALRYQFEAPDPLRFPCVALAYEALAAGGTVPAVLSAANEVAVDAFVEGRISGKSQRLSNKPWNALARRRLVWTGYAWPIERHE